jgi:hypothetical protein
LSCLGRRRGQLIIPGTEEQNMEEGIEKKVIESKVASYCLSLRVLCNPQPINISMTLRKDIEQVALHKKLTTKLKILKDP